MVNGLAPQVIWGAHQLTQHIKVGPRRVVSTFFKMGRLHVTLAVASSMCLTPHVLGGQADPGANGVMAMEDRIHGRQPVQQGSTFMTRLISPMASERFEGYIAIIGQTPRTCLAKIARG